MNEERIGLLLRQVEHITWLFVTHIFMSCCDKRNIYVVIRGHRYSCYDANRTYCIERNV